VTLQVPSAYVLSSEGRKPDPPKPNVGHDQSRSSPTLIYECYHPQTHEEVREYIDFILGSRRILPNEVEDVDSDVLDTDLPEDIPRQEEGMKNGDREEVRDGEAQWQGLSSESRLRQYLERQTMKGRQING
jgi:hypothetical protein